MIVAIRTRFPITVTDRTKMADTFSFLTPQLRCHRKTNTVVKHQGRITVRGVRSMRLSRVLVKLSWFLKTVKWKSCRLQYEIYNLISFIRFKFDLGSQISSVVSEEMKKFKCLKIAGQFSVEIATEKLLTTWNIVFGCPLNRSKLNQYVTIVFSNSTWKVKKEG